MSTSLSKEEMRNARLRALGIGPDAQTATVAQEQSTEDPAGKKQARANSTRSLDIKELNVIQKVVYRGGNATEEDMLRWYNQGFTFCDSPSYGLKQGNGGPCGILAVVQAEILREMLFKEDNVITELPIVQIAQQQFLLATAICTILHRASENGHIHFVHIAPSNWDKSMSQWDLSQVSVTSYGSKEEAQLELEGTLQDLLGSRMGCVALLLSLILSRGVGRLVEDMDDPSNTLIGQFGHCNQDLLNLLLTGRATSNVMDGQVALGDSGLVVKGVFQRGAVGYLSHLEALRYCEVGSYLKVPSVPIWVVGSSSHFSVLFSLERAVNEESQSQRLLSALQRAFKAVDTDECGFIPATRLQEALEQINLHNEHPSPPLRSILHNPTDLARLRGHLQIDGEIVLWAAFWVGVSSIMSGVSLDDLIVSTGTAAFAGGSGGSGGGGGGVINLADAGSLTNPFSVDGYDTYDSSGRVRSDSELARELQAQMDGELLLEATGNSGGGSSNVGVSNAGGGSSGVKSGTAGASTNTGGISALDFSSLTSILNNTTTNTNTHATSTGTNTINHTASMEVGPPTPASHSITIPGTPFTSTTTPNTSYTAASTNPTSPMNTTTTANTNRNTNTSTNTAAMRERSDSELARELQAQWDAEDGGFDYDASAFEPDGGAGPTRLKHSSSMDVQPDSSAAYLTDHTSSDHYLDDLPDLESGVGSDMGGASSSSGYNTKMPATSSATVGTSTSVAASSASNTERFTLHHFNGLESAGRSATLTSFTLTVRSAVSAVGQVVAFEGGEHSSFGSFSCPIEEVLRTRWPGCSVDWRGQTPPSID